MEKSLFIIVGYLINASLLYILSKCISEFNLLRWLCEHLPNWLGGIIGFILLVFGGFISGCMVFRFGGFVYEAITISNIPLLIQYIIADIICMLYFYVITNKLRK